MTAAVVNLNFFSKGLNARSRRFALRRDPVTTIYGDVPELWASRLWHRVSGIPAAMSGETCVIWSMSGVAALGFAVLVIGGGTL